jgi:co-chaperonin GroES (HSP10)
MKIQAVNDYIIVKLFIKKNVGGLVIADKDGTRLKDDFKYEPVSEVYSVGEKCEILKTGDKVILTKPHFLLINKDLMKKIDPKAGDEYDYIKAKEEDVLAIIN